jgi:hypothetical protein
MSIGMQTLSGLANSHPLVKTAIKYWWLALPAGWALYTLTKERPKVTVGGAITDFSMTFGPIIGLIMLAETMERNQKLDVAAAAAPAKALPVSGEIREAQFNITSGRAAPGVPPGTTPNFKVPMQFPR